MRNLLYPVAALAVVFLLVSATPKAERVRRLDFCQVYGAVYLESERNFADVRIFVEPTEGLARLSVFREDNILYADRPGVWYITDNRNEADFRVYIEKTRGFADFSIFYIDNPSFAGCR